MASSTIKLENPDLDTKIEISLVEKAILDYEKCSSSKLADWTAEKIGQQRGYLSHMVRLNLEWTPENEKLPKSVVLKIPTMDTLNDVVESVKTNMENLSMDFNQEQERPADEQFVPKDFVHNAQKNECGFYNYARDQEWQTEIPKCYLANVKNPALLVFEDLSDSKFTVFDEGLTLKQALQTVELLAELHAHCIKHPDFKDSPHFDNENLLLASGEQMVQSFKPLAEMSKKKNPDLFDPLADRLPEIAESTESLQYITEMNKMFGLPPVVVHGDLHVQNMAFDKDDSDKLRSIFDWQLAHTGCVVEDIGRLLCFSAEPDLRRDHLDAILTHYHRSLGGRLSPMKTPFSYDTLHKAYEKVTRYATVTCIGGLFIISSMSDKLGEDAEAKGEKLLIRAKCLLEDCLALMDAGKT